MALTIKTRGHLLAYWMDEEEGYDPWPEYELIHPKSCRPKRWRDENGGSHSYTYHDCAEQCTLDGIGMDAVLVPFKHALPEVAAKVKDRPNAFLDHEALRPGLYEIKGRVEVNGGGWYNEPDVDEWIDIKRVVTYFPKDMAEAIEIGYEICDDHDAVWLAGLLMFGTPREQSVVRGYLREEDDLAIEVQELLDLWRTGVKVREAA